MSRNVKRFVRESFGSLLELDIVLLMHGRRPTWCTAEDLAVDLRIRASQAQAALERLAARNLLDVRIGGKLSYSLSPVAAEDLAMLDELAADPYAAREYLLRASRASARRFAEAFRLRSSDG